MALAASISLAAIAGAPFLRFVSLFVWLSDSNSNGESIAAVSELKQANKEHLEHWNILLGMSQKVIVMTTMPKTITPWVTATVMRKGMTRGRKKEKESMEMKHQFAMQKYLRHWRMSHPMTLWNMVANQTRQRMLIVNITKPLGSRLNPATTTHLVRLAI